MDPFYYPERVSLIMPALPLLLFSGPQEKMKTTGSLLDVLTVGNRIEMFEKRGVFG